jgi:hypothetical protein
VVALAADEGAPPSLADELASNKSVAGDSKSPDSSSEESSDDESTDDSESKADSDDADLEEIKEKIENMDEDDDEDGGPAVTGPLRTKNEIAVSAEIRWFSRGICFLSHVLTFAAFPTFPFVRNFLRWRN